MAERYTLKKGDRVVVVDALLANGPFAFLEHGDTGTLTEDDNDSVPYVKWDGKDWPDSGHDGNFAAIILGLEKIND